MENLKGGKESSDCFNHRSFLPIYNHLHFPIPETEKKHGVIGNTHFVDLCAPKCSLKNGWTGKRRLKKRES